MNITKCLLAFLLVGFVPHGADAIEITLHCPTNELNAEKFVKAPPSADDKYSYYIKPGNPLVVKATAPDNWRSMKSYEYTSARDSYKLKEIEFSKADIQGEYQLPTCIYKLIFSGIIFKGGNNVDFPIAYKGEDVTDCKVSDEQAFNCTEKTPSTQATK